MKTKLLYSFLILIFFGISPFTLYAQNPKVEKVHIIFKTHLDVGFTDLSSNVEKRYVNDFIPKAIQVAEELRRSGGKERYVWTTGSWLIWTFLKQASLEQVKQLEGAIAKGDIVWNAVPYTVESESMSKDHFETLLKLSKNLDKRFGKKTTAAKMTDVPGHTRGIVPLLAAADIQFLHIGVNPASVVPHVPELSLWRDQNQKEIVLMYQKDYGSDAVLPDGKTAVVVAFTGDNHGPHTANAVREIYTGIQKRYPNAKLMASTLSDVADEVVKMKSLLPVVTSEIGDTWIHGYGSSPIRMARFRALSRLYSQWIKEGKLDPQSEASLNFAVSLGLVAEHTWGLDVKSHLKNWDKYTFDSFQQARNLPEFKRIETSWQEKDARINEAISYLPKQLQLVANQTIAKIGQPEKQSIKTSKRSKDITTEGALIIDNKGERMIAGKLSYQSFSTKELNYFRDTYITNKVGWAISDFGKPGLTDQMSKSVTLQAHVVNSDYKLNKGRTAIASQLELPKDQGVDPRVFPKEIYSNYSISPSKKEIDLSITLMDKPANRLPEAYWLSFTPEHIKDIIVEKTGQPVNVLDVVAGGNRQMHGIDRYVDIITTNGRIRITSLDALLVAVGEASLLNYSLDQPDIKKGIHFCLFNNVWGTNFSMWFEGSITYRFKIEFLK